MAKKEELVGPLKTKEGDSLGGSEVGTLPTPDVKDPLGYIKAKGASGKGKSYD